MSCAETAVYSAWSVKPRKSDKAGLQISLSHYQGLYAKKILITVVLINGITQWIN